ncbi:hypothetical protein N657DRAFT_159033 [Parathielavia appendiculata]|uniref:Uncharacterized protein n=1 Tax=Parathielavia appendiculata TaxID=2587402 RepID=A0AAN6TTU6_9PEZI|nr:hypothetical protein N657DRAFT_159033 [Parathielavia appendiculata]
MIVPVPARCFLFLFSFFFFICGLYRWICGIYLGLYQTSLHRRRPMDASTWIRIAQRHVTRHNLSRAGIGRLIELRCKCACLASGGIDDYKVGHVSLF